MEIDCSTVGWSSLRKLYQDLTSVGSGSHRSANKQQQMGKKKTARGALLAANLPQLQNLIKRDPDGYKDEVYTIFHS